MISAADLAQAIGCTVARAQAWALPLGEAMAIFAIDTPKRQAAFLAQIGHESGRLAYVREIWGPTPAQVRYEYRVDLGNREVGDGRRYCGRGLIQITGRANYRECFTSLAEYVPDPPDFEAKPEALEQPRWAALSAGWFWHTRGCNALADAEAFIQLTKRINGGLNGYEDRLALFGRAKEVLA